MLLQIDRSKPFNLTELIGDNWEIEEEDKRSLALTEIDLTAVMLEHMLKDGEDRIQGEEKLARLKAMDYIRLDAKVFQTLWENQHLIPEHWKEMTAGYITFIFFDGTILRRKSRDYRYVLFLCWDGFKWNWGRRWFEDGWCVINPSAVLVA